MEIKRIKLNDNRDWNLANAYPESGIYKVDDKVNVYYVVVNKSKQEVTYIGIASDYEHILETDSNQTQGLLDTKNHHAIPKEENTEYNGMVSEKFVLDLIKAIK